MEPASDPSFRNVEESSELARLWPVEGRGEAARLFAAEELARRRPFRYRGDLGFSGKTRLPVSIEAIGQMN